MRLFYACHRIPYPPDKGDKIRSFHLLEGLCRHHEVDLLTLADRDRDMDHLGPLREMCATVHLKRLRPTVAKMKSMAALALGRSLSVEYFRHQALMNEAKAMARAHPYDAAIAYSSTMYPYLAPIEAPKIVDLVDVDSEKFRLYGERRESRLWPLWAIEGRRLREFECQITCEAALSLLCTDEEVSLFRTFGSPRRLETLRNGVDLERIGYQLPEAARPSAVFVGAMDYKPNIEGVAWFVSEVLPSIRAEHGDFRFHIVGRDPVAAVTKLHDGDAVVVEGGVPDVIPYLRQASLSVAPLRVACGIQNKVLESLAAGTPTVATPEAARGIGTVSGEHLEEADGAPSFASAVLGLLKDAERGARMARKGREFVEEHYAWRASQDRLEAMILEVVEARDSMAVPS